MKKSKLLIPALSIASVGAVVAPMVTSCAKKDGYVMFFENGEYKEFTPSLKPVESTEKLTVAEAAKLYFASSNSIQAMKEDIYAELGVESVITAVISIYFPLIWGEKYEGKLVAAKGLVSNMKVDYKEGQTKARLSGDITLELNIDVSEESSNSKVADYTLTVGYEIKNVSYNLWNHAKTQTEDEYWSVGISKDPTVMAADKEWSIKRSYMGKVVYVEDGFVEEDGDYSTWYWDVLPGSTEEEIAGKLNFIQWNCDYLQNIKKA